MKKLIFIFTALYTFGLGAYTELELNGSYSNYKNSSTTYTKSYMLGGSIAYRFISASALELAYSKTHQIQTAPYITTTGQIQVASVNLLIYLLGMKYRLQPFVKVGAGYMKREYLYEYDIPGYPAIRIISESMSVTFGGGIKYYLTGNFAIQGSATGYISDFSEERPFIHHTISVGITILY